MVEIVLQGEGESGACGEYLANTVHHLIALGLSDARLERLLVLVEERCGRRLLAHPHLE